MEKCNHPNCHGGVMYVETISGVINMTRCPYCKREETSLKQRREALRKKLNLPPKGVV